MVEPLLNVGESVKKRLNVTKSRFCSRQRNGEKKNGAMTDPSGSIQRLKKKKNEEQIIVKQETKLLV